MASIDNRSVGKLHDAFISYSSKDKDKAYELCNLLEGKNIKCWIAPRDILGGDSYAGNIISAIDNTHVLVLLFSSNSNASEDVLREVAHASRNKIRIIPYIIEKASLSQDMNYYIGHLQHIDGTSQNSSSVEKLMDDINAIKNQNEKTDKNTTLHTTTPKSSKYSIMGRVITDVNGKVGIGGAYVALIDANLPKSVYYEKATDAYGYYQFSDIDIKGKSGYYQIYSSKSPYGNSYSDQFTLEEGNEKIVNVEIRPKPVRILLKGERGHFNRDGTFKVDDSESIIICAYVYNALGNPVDDGCHVMFNLLNAAPDAGKLASMTAQISNDYMVGAFTKDGVAKVKYLWALGGRSCKIQASLTQDLSIYAMIDLMK